MKDSRKESSLTLYFILFWKKEIENVRKRRKWTWEERKEIVKSCVCKERRKKNKVVNQYEAPYMVFLYECPVEWYKRQNFSVREKRRRKKEEGGLLYMYIYTIVHFEIFSLLLFLVIALSRFSRTRRMKMNGLDVRWMDMNGHIHIFRI